jgi:O-acetyl-ADP-ribose deacetylase (regulator of RNase III)
MALLPGRSAPRRAMLAASLRRRKAASTSSAASKLQARARICDSAQYAARARKPPSFAYTPTVSPLAGLPSMRSTAPEKIQGWRWRSDFSRPALMVSRASLLFIIGPIMTPVRIHDRLLVKVGDLTREAVDAIVNAANAALMGGGGVDGAIHRAGGPDILAECREMRRTQYPDGLPTGQAVITTGGKLPARFVIHTVGPVYGQHGGDEARLLGDCYRNAIALAAQSALRTLAFPAISTGVYGYPKDEAARVSLAAIEEALQRHPQIEEVRLVYFSEADASFVIPA